MLQQNALAISILLSTANIPVLIRLRKDFGDVVIVSRTERLYLEGVDLNFSESILLRAPVIPFGTPTKSCKWVVALLRS
jgi:hypothetical protein